MNIEYFVLKADGSYNKELFEPGTAKKPGWLTEQEYQARYPYGHFAGTLEDIRAEAKKQLREKRKTVEYGGFQYSGQRWDSAEKDELRLNSMLKMFEMTGATEFSGWKIAEGVYVTATPALLQGAAMSLMQHYAHAFAMEASKIQTIEGLQTVAEVQEWLHGGLNADWNI